MYPSICSKIALNFVFDSIYSSFGDILLELQTPQKAIQKNELHWSHQVAKRARHQEGWWLLLRVWRGEDFTQHTFVSPNMHIGKKTNFFFSLTFIFMLYT